MTIKTRKIDAVLKNPDGTIVFEKKDFEIPEHFSDRAGLIAASKYATPEENSVLDIIDRVVYQIVRWGCEQGYFDDSSDLNRAMETIDYGDLKLDSALRDILINQRAAFNSPVWFNIGAKHHVPQASACFVLDVQDNMEDILDLAKRDGMIFMGGSGSGVNISNLRAAGEPVSGGGFSSGPLSFMKIHDAVAGCVRSGGRTRRSAMLVCMDVDHPDIMEFIECKLKEENKAKILMDASVSAEDAYATVAFQNANHSISITDDFMRAVIEEKDYNLMNRTDGSIAKTVSAKEIFHKIAETAWKTGDPGLLFNKRINEDNPIPSLGEIRSTNPCGEHCAVNNSSCNLASLNLVKYSTKDGFAWKQFSDDIKALITAMDILIDPAYYPTKEIGDTTRATRPLGLGFTNLGAFLMQKGIPYDSKEAQEWARSITLYMTEVAYSQSIYLAKRLGSFKAFEDNRETNTKLAMRLTSTKEGEYVWQGIKRHGLRNSQVTLLAPAGTISFLMDCDTTGIEPLFALTSIKQLAGGGTMEIAPDCVEESISKIANLPQENVKANHPDLSIDNYIEIYVPEDKQAVFATANEISWKGHIDMMAACQPSLNGAISKSVNMRNDCTIQDIEEAYMYAWERGLKGLAIYRDGSKEMQPLTEVRAEEKKEELINSITKEYDENVTPEELNEILDKVKEEKMAESARTYKTAEDTINSWPDWKKELAKPQTPETEEEQEESLLIKEGLKTLEGAYSDLDAKPIEELTVEDMVNPEKENSVTLTDNQEKLKIHMGSSLDDMLKEDGILDETEEQAIANLGFSSWAATRKRLPDTRSSVTHKFDIAGSEGYITAGLYEDGTLGEVFINMQGNGSTLQGLMDSFATAISMALQYGVPLERLANKFINSRFEPSGITQNPDIRMTSSLMDYIFRWLSLEFLDNEEDETFVPEPREEEKKEQLDPKFKQPILDNKKVSSGPPCTNCGSLTQRAGACFCCTSCGNSSGCG
ncbi:MAG: adenosylcobalamin-dependent ribonucleoside-diphosphate reductase [Deltaproteobacteria bacterium]|nr:MAG: adenosylcobalamin-dependent ribonucleoside-diphosphate reductase [Deltaproteobacteria bacterium]